MSEQKIQSLLEVNDLVLFVHLGCGPDERAHPQEVKLNIKVAFTEPLIAETSDQLEHSVCYAEMSQAVEGLVKNNKFALVEKLAKDIFNTIKPMVPPSALLKVTVHKIRPPITALSGGVRYSCGDMNL